MDAVVSLRNVRSIGSHGCAHKGVACDRMGLPFHCRKPDFIPMQRTYTKLKHWRGVCGILPPRARQFWGFWYLSSTVQWGARTRRCALRRKTGADRGVCLIAQWRNTISRRVLWIERDGVHAAHHPGKRGIKSMRRIDANTIFDVASLTKVIVTATADAVVDRRGQTRHG